MPNAVLYHALNVGVVDRDKLHRVDLERMRLAAEDQTNLLCDAVGKAFLRPGTEHFDTTYGGGYARLIPFDAGGPRVYGLELTGSNMRIWDGDAKVTRPAVSSAVTNGDMSSATGWTLGTDAGTIATMTGGALKLQAFGRGARAYARQQISVASADRGKEHGLRITVFRGQVRFRVGTSAGAQDVIKETVLRTGYHSIAFIASASATSFWIEFSTKTNYPVYVNDCNVEAAGDVVLPTVWAADDLQYIRYDQSLDVMFLACEGRKPQRIESRGDNSWSVCDYDADDGPFLVGRTADARLKPTVLEGSGLLQSDVPFFSTDHIGAIFRLFHDGQKIDTYLAADNTFTPTIMVTGINEPDYNERAFSYTVDGTFAGTLRWQRSFDGEDVEFHRFRRAQGVADIDITGAFSATNDDNEDNAIAYYKLGFEENTHTSGAAHVTITYQGGGGFGICRVVGINSSTEAVIEVLKPFSGNSFTDNWREGAWSESVGWPTCVAMDDGRLNWSGYDQFWGSVSDAYESFDEDFIGDAGPLLRALAVGGRNEARWMIALSTLMIGTNRMIAGVRASSLDEIKTPENFGVRRTGGQVGAARINPAVLADDRALFVEAEGTALYELNYDATKARFLSTEFSKLTTDLFDAGINGLAVQNRPDQRIWITVNDSDACCIVFEPAQQVVAFIPISTGVAGDIIESMIVLPSDDGQDRVLCSVRRTVNSVTTRRIERLALDYEAIPASITKCLDAHVVIGAGSTSVTGLSHLIGRDVWAWVDGEYVSDANGDPVNFTVSAGGTITLPSAPAIGGCVGQPYTGRYKSAKLEYGGGASTSMLQKKVVSRVGLMFADYCRSGIRYGTEFDNADHPLYNLPAERDGIPVLDDIILGPDEVEPLHPVDAPITLDARVCIEVSKPATILAMVMEFEGHG